MRSKKVITAAAAGLLIGTLTMSTGLSPAGAKSGQEVCAGLDSGKIDVDGDQASVTVTAPEGYLISGYCVKGGTLVEYVAVDPPQEEIEITVSNDKDVSHYAVSYVEDEGPSS